MFGEWTLVLSILGSIQYLLFTVAHFITYTVFFGIVFLFKKKFLLRNSIMFKNIKRLLISRAIIFTVCALFLETIGWIFFSEDLKKVFGTPIDWLFTGEEDLYNTLLLKISFVFVLVFYLFDLFTTSIGIKLSKSINFLILCAHELALSMIIINLAYPMYFV